jgi:peptide/nickel transport system permease protein
MAARKDLTTAPVKGPATTALVEAQPSIGLWREAWMRFKKNRRSLAAGWVLVIFAVVAIFHPFIAGTKPIVCKYKGSMYFPALGYFRSTWENAIFTTDRFRGTYPANLKKKDPESWAVWPLVYADPYRNIEAKDWKDVPGFEGVEPTEYNHAPTRGHWFGTDEFGRSVFARMIHGTAIALLVGFLSVGIAASIGFVLGSIAGYYGGWADIALSRLMEVVLSIPSLILILALIAIVDQPTIFHLMAVLGVTGWVGIARLTRGEFLKLKTLDYVVAARALGLSAPRIILRHMLPNALAPALVSISFGIAGAILTESGLSFLGFGVQPPTPSWGAILRGGFADYTQWWLILFPGLAVFVAVLTYNLIGDGLQQAIDPRLR